MARASTFSKAVEKLQMTGSVTQRDLHESNNPGAHTYLRLHKALLMELKSAGVRGRGRRTKFLLREITVWNTHTRMSTSHVDLISTAFLVPPSYPERLQQPVNTLQRPTHYGPSNTLGGSAVARPVTPGPWRV